MAFRSSVKAVGVITATVVVLLLMGMTYSLRDKRFIAEYLNNSNDVLLKIDDVDVSVTVFLDNNRTRFYDAYDWDPENPLRTCRRILIAFQDQEVDYPKLLSVSQRGIGVVGGWARVWKLGGRRYIVQKDCEGVDYDVRGDMKGLDADIEMHSSDGFVEYIIKRRTQGKPRELILRIKNCLHDYILVLGTGDSLHNASGKGHGMDEMIYASTYAVDKACLASTATVDERHKEVLNDGLQAKDDLKSAQLASEKNQVMDALLDQLQIPSDYADVMIGLYRDKSQDVVTRDFAVQHIGHYALALNRRGQYDADSAEATTIRATLFDAASETHSIVAAAAFRALADMSEFDSSIDARRLDSLLVACAADAAAEPAARAMAIHLCGERRISSARQTLAAIIADPGSPEGAQRLSAEGGSTRGAGCPRTAGRASRSGQDPESRLCQQLGSTVRNRTRMSAQCGNLLAFAPGI